MPTPAAGRAKVHPGKAFRGKGKKTSDPLPPADRLKRLYNSLVAQIDGEHWKGAEKTCDKILRIDPDDSDARQTKLFIHLQREEYDKALDLIEDASSADSGTRSHRKLFEKAYALYRMKQETEAQDVLDQIKENGEGEEERGIMHLEAQLNYRQGNYQLAYDLYQQLLDTADPSSEEHHDVQTNLHAAQTYLDFINSGYLQAMDDARSANPATTAALRDIENIPPPVVPTSVVTPAIPSTFSAKASGVVEANKKVRAKRLPKGVIPGVTPPPDPERWIKKSQRSTKPTYGRKSNKGRTTGATQGFTTEAPTSSGVAVSAAGGGGKSRKKK